MYVGYGSVVKALPFLDLKPLNDYFGKQWRLMKFRIAVNNVRRHSGVHTFSDNLHYAKSLSV